MVLFNGNRLAGRKSIFVALLLIGLVAYPAKMMALTVEAVTVENVQSRMDAMGNAVCDIAFSMRLQWTRSDDIANRDYVLFVLGPSARSRHVNADWSFVSASAQGRVHRFSMSVDRRFASAQSPLMLRIFDVTTPHPPANYPSPLAANSIPTQRLLAAGGECAILAQQTR